MAASKPPSLTTLQNRAARAVLELIARAQTNKPLKLEIEVPLVDDRIAVVAGTVTVRGGIGAAPPPPPPPLLPPRITAQPRGATTVPGATVELTATFEGGTPLTVQWLRNDVPLGIPLLAAGNTSSLTTPALTLGDNGVAYKLRVTNSVNSATSDAAVIVVQSTAIPSGVYVLSRMLNAVATIFVQGMLPGSRYDRGLQPIRWTGTGNRTVEIKRFDFASGGVVRPLLGTTYTLTIDGTAHSTETRSGDSVTFTVDQNALTEGWHWIDVLVNGTGETVYPCCVYMRKGPTAAAETLMPIITHTYEAYHPTLGIYEDKLLVTTPSDAGRVFYGMVPARFQPHVQPLAARQHPAFNTVLPADQYVCEQMVPSRSTDIHRTTVLEDGLVNCWGIQPYDFSAFVAKRPGWALLDGPRGHGTVSGAMHLMPGRDGKVYGLDPWRLFRVDTDGTVTTLVGYRNTPGQTPTRYNVPEVDSNLELVGDWSAIPVERRGMHEAWGFVWWGRTVLENTAAAPIPEQHNERPHIVNLPTYGGPVGFITDTQNNRVLRIEFSGFDRSLPAKVTEFITGAGDPWDIAIKGDILYVTERTLHRVSKYDAFTGQYLGAVLQGADLGFVDVNRKPRTRGATLAQIQAQPCVLPEGCVIVDDLLYVGSLLMQQVLIIDLTTEQIVRRQAAYSDGNSFYYKIAVSDGTFLPRHTICLQTWTARKYGYPFFYLPDGTEVSFISGTQNVHTVWGDGIYGTAACFGNGCLYVTQVGEGLNKVSRRLPTDLPRPAAAVAGARKYWERGYRNLNGRNGWGHYGLPLPWGEDTDIDAFLTYVGHVRPAV